MSSRALLSGEVVNHNEELEALREENDRLQQDLRQARLDLIKSQNESVTARAAIQALRQTLSPLHRALRGVFGELDLVSGTTEAVNGSPGTPETSPLTNKAWDLWKQRLPGYPAKFIDALLAHKDLDSRQLSITTGCHYTNVAKVIYKLNQAGLINKNGNRYSLREL